MQKKQTKKNCKGANILLHHIMSKKGQEEPGDNKNVTYYYVPHWKASWPKEEKEVDS